MDDIYSDFMIQIFNCLEYRLFACKQVIANELEEASEVLYVESGIYKIGYEINKKVYFGRQFGRISMIGGHQVCNN